MKRTETHKTILYQKIGRLIYDDMINRKDITIDIKKGAIRDTKDIIKKVACLYGVSINLDDVNNAVKYFGI